jgi:uncharacterized membrane protein YwaF
LILVFKDAIQRLLKKNQWWITVGGIIGLLFFCLNRFLLGYGNYPLKWELVPLHMCRLAVLLILILMVIKKLKYIKYLIFWAEVGAIIGLLYFRLHGVYAGTTFESKGKSLREYYYTDVGLDSYFWWDYAITHYFALLMPPFLWTGLKIKASWRDMWWSLFTLWILGTIAYVVDGIFVTKHVDYIYLSSDPTFSLPGVFGIYPYMYASYTFLFLFGINLIYLIWILEGFFDFRRFKFKHNENLQYFKDTWGKHKNKN